MSATRKFPELEFETAAWTLHFWGQVVASRDEEDNRRLEIVKKIPALQKMIGQGIRRGHQSDLPNEIVLDEHYATQEAVKTLRYAIREEESRDRIERHIRDAEQCYQLTLPALRKAKVRAVRPLLLCPSGRDIDVLAGKAQPYRIRRKMPSPSCFHMTITGHFIGYAYKSTRKKIDAARRSKRPWPRATGEQQYLVAMVLLGARQTNVKSGTLLKVLSALCISEYPALALYHLAKRAGIPKGDLEDVFDVATVRKVCDALVSEHQDAAPHLIAQYNAMPWPD